MTLGRLGKALTMHKSDFVSDRAIAQHGSVALTFDDAPGWPEGHGLADEAIIESFLVDGRELMPLSDSEWLVRWRPRAQALVDRLFDSLEVAGVTTAGPGYLTCSITPTHLLEGEVHVDDDQYAADDGVGVVAINGQHVGPRVATGRAPLTDEARTGPLPFEADCLGLGGPIDGEPAAPVDRIVVLAGFGQIHAGPATSDLGPDPAPFRQLMVFRAPTLPR